MPDASDVLTVKVVVSPCTTVRLEGVNAREKSLVVAAVTVSCAFVVCPAGCEVEMPLMVNVWPTVIVAPLAAARINVELAPAVVLLGLKEAVTP